ncbi:MAG: glycosyltransferase [Acidobacterium ailaaui]|nr:glycosyltransferase [Pseudacidobacterium ailaaui]
MRIAASPAFKLRHYNPYTWLLYKNMPVQVDEFSWFDLRSKYDILHLHWPESDINASNNPLIAFARTRWKLFVIDYLKTRGTKLIWTVHNLKSHESLHPRLEHWLWRQFIPRVDGIISLTSTALHAVLSEHQALESIPSFIIPHGHYRDEYPNDENLNAREILGIKHDQKILLFFGSIRPYKGVAKLITAFREVSGEDLLLYIVGQIPTKEKEAEYLSLAAGDARVHLHLKPTFIPKNKVQIYFQAADLVVLPYQEILNSGTALLALSYNRPILVPDQGSMGELASHVGNTWVRTYSGDITGSILQDALNWALTLSRTKLAPLHNFDWPKISLETLKAYEAVLNKSGFSS